MKTNLIAALLCASSLSWGQKEITLSSHPKKVTVFFEGAQIEQSGQVNLSKGRQWVVIEKLTDEMDEASVRVKGKGNFTILSVKSRKNFEDQVATNSELEALNNKKKSLEDKQNGLLDQLDVLDFDEGVLNSNYQLKSEKEGISIATLKEASLFFHSKMSEIKQQRRTVSNQLDAVVLELNKVSQEIQARRSKPIINYSEVVVEVEAETTTTGTFELSYITNAASWSPYYDLRADGIGKPIRLESKAKVRQNTGIDWKDVDLVLSTSNPYENSQEPDLKPWYLYYNNYYYAQPTYQKRSTKKDFSGQTIRGQVIDIQTGQALPFCNITVPGTSKIAVTDFDGKFAIDVPEGFNAINAQFVGYQSNYQTINSAYMKLFMYSGSQKLKTVEISSKYSQMAPASSETKNGYIDGSIAMRDEAATADAKEKEYYKKSTRHAASGYGAKDGEADYSEELQVAAISKDMRMEYVIAEKFTVLADGAGHGVNIKTYELQANFEYHSIPKIDPSVYLVAGVYGWEKYNLMTAEANLYFDGTFIGTSNLDPNSTKDTINFSLGKEKGMVITRTNVNELNKEKSVGTRKKVSYNYEIEVRNNKAAAIPLIIKDQFPITQDADIKIRTGKYDGATLDDKTQILTWRLLLKPTEKTTLKLDYDVDYDKSKYLRTE